MTSPQFRYAALCLTSATLFGCATSSSPTVGSNVQYGDAKAVEQVTNEFGSTDLQTIAESMPVRWRKTPPASKPNHWSRLPMSKTKPANTSIPNRLPIPSAPS